MIRLMVVDDHEMVRAGLRSLLGRVDDMEIVAEAGDVAEAVAQAIAASPDVVLMDLRLPDGSGIDACREILSCVATRVLFLTSFEDDVACLSAVMSGASGYFLKDIGSQALEGAIRDVAAGRKVGDAGAMRSMADLMREDPGLSQQECRVLGLVVEGKTNRQIGDELGLTEKTVRNYLSNAFQKLGVSRRSHAAVIFTRGRARNE
ncbi:MAG TPA: response regulator transcription factor [Usitatibacter sp.]|nr:response regulator transcription factor [Usitatibacter sp.]